MIEKESPLSPYEEFLEEFRKGQIVRLNPDGVYDFPFEKEQIGIVLGVKREESGYRPRSGVIVWLQKDKQKVLLEPWDLFICKR